MLRQLETLIWIITGRCNLHCPYCYALQYANDKELDTDVVKHVLEEASLLGVNYIQFTGGEPLLRKDIIDLISASTSLSMDTSLFTNLTLLKSSLAARLARMDIKIYTSLDGPQRIYEAIKGIGAWSRFLNGVHLVKSFGLWLHINIPISSLNYQYISEAIRLAISLEANSISVIPAMPSGRALKTRSYVTASQLLKALQQAEEVAREMGIYIGAWCMPFVKGLPWAKRLVASNCRDWGVMDIAPNGDVLLCDVTSLRVSNVVLDGVKEAWEKLIKHPLLKAANQVPKACTSCPIAEWCKGGCYARAWLLYKDLPAPDPLCPIRTNIA